MAAPYSKYSEEFRGSIIERVRDGKTPAELSREHGCSAQAIRNWLVRVAQDLRELQCAKDFCKNDGARQGLMRRPRRSNNAERVGYIRYSPTAQSFERQLDGVDLDCVFEDQVSLRDRDWPELLAALEYLCPGDTFVVHSFDRIARKTNQLLQIVRQLTNQRVIVEFHKPRLVFTGSACTEDLQWKMLLAFADFDRQRLFELQKEGVAAAKRKGVYKGKRKSLTPEQVAELRQRLAAGVLKSDLARSYGIATRTLYDYLKGT